MADGTLLRDEVIPAAIWQRMTTMKLSPIKELERAQKARQVLLPARLKSNAMVVESLDIDSLIFPARTPRRHPPGKMAMLQASLDQHGQMVPILVSDTNEVIAGRARVEALRNMGHRSVLAIRVSHLKHNEVQLYRIANNRFVELGEWTNDLKLELQDLTVDLDLKIELSGFTTGEVDVALSTTGAEHQPDAADLAVEPTGVPVTRAGDLWELDGHRLVCGDSLQKKTYEQLLGEERVRMIFGDVPYNVPISGHATGLGKVRHREFAMASGEMSETQYTGFLGSAFAHNYEYLLDGGVAFYCQDWRHLYELLVSQRQSGFSLLNLCVWAKTNGGMGSLYRSQHEFVAVMKKGSAPHINNVQLGRFGRYRTNLWTYAGVNSFRKGRDEDLAVHPTVKPLALVADAIRDVTRHGDLVLDPFVGSGTTILAAERTGRRARAIEIDPGYVDVTIRRWSAMTGKQAVLESTGQTFDVVARERKEDPSSPPENEPASRCRVRTRTRPVVPATAES